MLESLIESMLEPLVVSLVTGDGGAPSFAVTMDRTDITWDSSVITWDQI